MSKNRNSPWLRTLVFFGGLAAVTGAYTRFQPDVGDARARIQDATLTLRSDEIAFASLAGMRSERARLLQRYGLAFKVDPEAQVMRELAAAVRRHGVTFASTQATAAVRSPDSPSGRRSEFEDVHLNLELQGTYRSVLLVIDELPRDCELARVESATLHRTGRELGAEVSLAVLRLAGG
jgi:hypothetical protein